MEIQKIDIQENRNNIAKKAKGLVKAKGELSETAQKMLAMLLGMIRVDDTEFQRYALRIEDYRMEIGSKNKDTEFYVKQAKELMSNPFKIDKQLFNWCSKVDWGSLDGYIIFDIHQDLKPYLLQLKEGNFLQYNITNIMKLKGKYSPRLYEYFKMQWSEYKYYHKSAKSYTFEIKIDWLRQFLNISKGYRYDNIKTQIIEKAKKDFKQYTDIKFTYKTQTLVGKKVDRLIITIKDNNKGSNSYLSSQKAFIAYVREKYKVTSDSMPTILEMNEGDLKIDLKGNLYLSAPGKIINYSNKEALAIWEWLYESAKKGEIVI